MRFLLVLLVWCAVFALCWPLAVLAVVLFPFVWLAALPFRLAFAVAEGFVALFRALFLLPARLLGQRPR